MRRSTGGREDPRRRCACGTLGAWTLLMLVTLCWSDLRAQVPHEAAFADWCGPDGHVVYSRKIAQRFQLHLRLPQGTDQQLAPSTGNDISPACSADGAMVYFVSDRDGNQELYRVSTVGGPAERLSWTAGAEMAPDVAPNGQVVFAYSPESDVARFGRSARLFVSDANGRQRKALLTAGVQHYPKWSPDGSRLSFSGYLSDTSSRYRVFVMRPGGAPRVASGSLAAFDSQWSMDGSILYCVSPRQRRGATLCGASRRDGAHRAHSERRRLVRTASVSRWRTSAGEGRPRGRSRGHRRTRPAGLVDRFPRQRRAAEALSTPVVATRRRRRKTMCIGSCERRRLRRNDE